MKLFMLLLLVSCSSPGPTPEGEFDDEDLKTLVDEIDKPTKKTIRK